MIFVTVGHQMPFDRMLCLVDRWSSQHDRHDVFAQTGESDFRPDSFQGEQWLTPDEYRQRLEECSGIISHAGTGTIIQGLVLEKPILVLPRLARYSETRNDHQVGTARYFESRGLIMAAYDDEGFSAALEQFESFTPADRITDRTAPELLERLESFIEGPSKEVQPG